MRKWLWLAVMVAVLTVGIAVAKDKVVRSQLITNQMGDERYITSSTVHNGQAQQIVSRVDLLTESFEYEFPPLGWSTMTSGESYPWVQSNAQAHSGSHSAFVQYGNQGTWQDEWLVSPALDMTGLGGPLLEFYEYEAYWVNYGLTHSIEVSTTVPDDPAAFTSIFDMTPTTHTITQWAEPVVVDLSAYAGMSNVYLAFRYQGSYADDWYVDDVKVYEPEEYDVAAVNIMPNGAILLAGSDVIPQCTVRNVGVMTVSFDVSMTAAYNGTGFYNETVTSPMLAFGETATLDFPSFVAQPGYYELTGTTLLEGDGEPGNDTFTALNQCFSGERTPFGMLFTEWGCPPCVAANQALDAWYPAQGNSACLIRVHVWWPAGNDPMYWANEEQCLYLLSIPPMEVWGVPCLLTDNVEPSTLDTFYDDWPTTVETYYAASAARASPLEIQLGYDQENSMAQAQVHILDPLNPQGDFRLFVVVTEDNVELLGPNGEPNHNQVFRYLYPGVEGLPIDPTMDFAEYWVELELDPTWVYDELRAVAFIQDMISGPVMNAATIFLNEGVVSNEGEPEQNEPENLPEYATNLAGAHPNPFNPQTTIFFTLASPQQVKLSIYDMMGHHVADLVDGVFAAGEHPVLWNGRDVTGRDCASGTYVVRMVTQDDVQSSKMMLVR